ncbi:MAG: RluA family pseudouridine synthase [Candidatus Rokuibacteriota bacterium]|nr:MAG: RluA family pseudouridine synthase [Candidatus Rokubacteria bacterium]
MIVSVADAGQRLDRWLAARLPELSRARLQTLIEGGRVTVGGRARKAAYRVRAGERVEAEIPPAEAQELRPEALPLEVVYEDDAVLVVNKPAGMVVHPGAGHAGGTLAAAVLAHAPETARVGGQRRPGIVHRLDKGTSGLLVVAKTRPAYDSLVAQLAARTVARRYLVVVHGLPTPSDGVIDAPIGRHPRDRVRMAVRPPGQGRRAVTRYRVLERFPAVPAAYLEARLETGRTHQIRVHLAARGHPVLGDDTYRPRSLPRPDLDPEGLALHAAELGFVHPLTGQPVAFAVAPPPRMARLLARLRGLESPTTPARRPAR